MKKILCGKKGVILKKVFVSIIMCFALSGCEKQQSQSSTEDSVQGDQKNSVELAQDVSTVEQ